MHGSLLRPGVLLAAACGMLAFCGAAALRAGDQPQWGQAWSRNMVSDEANLPADFDPATSRNVLWVAELGTQSYVSPIVSGGRVLVGTNNDRPRVARHTGDRGVLLCLDCRDGRLVWQLTVPKAGDDPYLDWPRCGLTSPPTVEGDRAYVLTNRGDVVCLDLAGMANGNNGPYRDEGRFMAPKGVESVPVKPDDADILWAFSVPEQAGTYLHDGAFSSILINGRHLYLNTCNGVDNTHKVIRRPDGPSLIVLDKQTGRLVARDAERIGPRIFHSTWAPPAMGEVNGRKLVFFGGGDGVCYAFEALDQDAGPADGEPRTLRKVWQFDCDPNAPKQDIHSYLGNRRESPSTIMAMPVFHAGKVFVAAGGDMWWGKTQCWLKCIDATKTGDVTRSAEVWSVALNSHCCSTPAIRDGLVYIADCGRCLRCLDAGTGKEYWTHQTDGEIWALALVADGKVYIGSRAGDFHILAAGRQKKLLCSVKLDSAISAPPTAADGRLYVCTMKRLYVLGNKASGTLTRP